MPQPEIVSSHGDHILVGEKLRLTCVVRVTKGEVVAMVWAYSSNEVGFSLVSPRCQLRGF